MQNLRRTCGSCERSKKGGSRAAENSVGPQLLSQEGVCSQWFLVENLVGLKWFLIGTFLLKGPESESTGCLEVRPRQDQMGHRVVDVTGSSSTPRGLCQHAGASSAPAGLTGPPVGPSDVFTSVTGSRLNDPTALTVNTARLHVLIRSKSAIINY